MCLLPELNNSTGQCASHTASIIAHSETVAIAKIYLEIDWFSEAVDLSYAKPRRRCDATKWPRTFFTKYNSFDWRAENYQRQVFWVRQSCLEEVDDLYCHHYFKRCYFSFSPQPVCREACEELTFKRCDREFKTVTAYNQLIRESPFYWDIIDCTIMPFRNESSNCYYPDKIRGQSTRY